MPLEWQLFGELRIVATVHSGRSPSIEQVYITRSRVAEARMVIPILDLFRPRPGKGAATEGRYARCKGDFEKLSPRRQLVRHWIEHSLRTLAWTA